jgi:CRP/FNR family transcriptional regulator, cyclic AMP receptor protein
LTFCSVDFPIAFDYHPPMEEKSKLWYLKKINLFNEMNAEDMGRLERATRMESVRKKTPIFFPGDPSQ